MSLVHYLVVTVMPFNIHVNPKHIAELDSYLADHFVTLENRFLSADVAMGQQALYCAADRSATSELYSRVVESAQSSPAISTRKPYIHAVISIEAPVGHYICDIQLPTCLQLPTCVALYLSYLKSNYYSSSTTATHLSGISFAPKLLEANDPINSLLVQRILTRMLKVWCVSANHKSHTHTAGAFCGFIRCLQMESRVLFQSVYWLVFHAFLLVGEMTISNGNTDNTYNRYSITKSVNLHITFLQHKHVQKAATIVAARQSMPDLFSVFAVHHYLKLQILTPGFWSMTLGHHPASPFIFHLNCISASIAAI